MTHAHARSLLIAERRRKLESAARAACNEPAPLTTPDQGTVQMAFDDIRTRAPVAQDGDTPHYPQDISAWEPLGDAAARVLAALVMGSAP